MTRTLACACATTTRSTRGVTATRLRPGVPQAIIELAYLTNATDRQYLIGDPEKLAQALSDSIQAFLATTP